MTVEENNYIMFLLGHFSRLEILMNRTIAIFANSVKHGMHCVAGKDVSNKNWIRPVANVSGAELDHDQCVYVNPYGRFTVKPLQKIEMSLISPAPLINQPENYLIAENEWVQRYNVDKDDVVNWLDYPDSLWGQGNKVSYDDILSGDVVINASLYLVSVEALRLERKGNRRRAIFQYSGCQYDLPCTDPNFDKQVVDPQHQGVLCISLGEAFTPKEGSNLFCYKIVATII